MCSFPSFTAPYPALHPHPIDYHGLIPHQQPTPHLHLTHKTAPKPPRRQQHRWIVYCASKIPGNPHPKKKEESFDPWSILGQITDSKSPSQSAGKKQPSSEHIKTLMATHMWGGPPYQHINTIILVYPWPAHIPTPTKPPNSELVWPLRILPHGLKLWQLVGNRRVEKMDGQAGFETKSMFFNCLCTHLLSFII